MGKCKNCKYWQVKNENSELKIEARAGHCHRYPPQLFFRQAAAHDRHLPLGAGKVIEAIQPGFEQTTPIVLGGGFCGEHKPKQN